MPEIHIQTIIIHQQSLIRAEHSLERLSSHQLNTKITSLGLLNPIALQLIPPVLLKTLRLILEKKHLPGLDLLKSGKDSPKTRKFPRT